MRRLVLATLGLIAGVTVLLSLKSGPGVTRSGGPVLAEPPVVPSGPVGPPPSGEPMPSSDPSGEAPGGSPDGMTFVGDSVYTEFGYVTVQITVVDGRITDVVAVEMPTDEARSAALSERVAPILRERALAAQSASFDTASGATWTSEAYQQSLQSALVKAGLG
jgi:uncharacterized protein with FMN-binding domain